jgi:hypothetical protein
MDLRLVQHLWQGKVGWSSDIRVKRGRGMLINYAVNFFLTLGKNLTLLRLLKKNHCLLKFDR